jgi:phosphoglucosamine mutase
MSNLGLENALREHGVVFERTQVGDRYIMERLSEKGWVLGGEQSGHIICLDRTTTGDGIISALQVLAEMHATGKSLQTLASGMSKYPQKLTNIRLGDKEPMEIMESDRVKKAVREAEIEMGSNGRVLLRPSGTEPLIRVMVEGVDLGLVELFSERIAGVVRELIEPQPA